MLQPKVTIFKGKKPQPGGTVIAATSSGIDYNPEHEAKIKNRAATGFKDVGVQGISVNKSGQATAKPFQRKVVVSQGGHTRIYGDDGKLIKEGEGHTKEIRDAVRASEKKADLTNEQRQRNTRASDLVNQTAKNITRSEVNSLAKAKLATGDPMGNANDPKALLEKEKQRAAHQRTEESSIQKGKLATAAAEKLAESKAAFLKREELKKQAIKNGTVKVRNSK